MEIMGFGDKWADLKFQLCHSISSVMLGKLFTFWSLLWSKKCFVSTNLHVEIYSPSQDIKRWNHGPALWHSQRKPLPETSTSHVGSLCSRHSTSNSLLNNGLRGKSGRWPKCLGPCSSCGRHGSWSWPQPLPAETIAAILGMNQVMEDLNLSPSLLLTFLLPLLVFQENKHTLLKGVGERVDQVGSLRGNQSSFLINTLLHS